jgi:hypothetical protein
VRKIPFWLNFFKTQSRPCMPMRTFYVTKSDLCILKDVVFRVVGRHYTVVDEFMISSFNLFIVDLSRFLDLCTVKLYNINADPLRTLSRLPIELWCFKFRWEILDEVLLLSSWFRQGQGSRTSWKSLNTFILTNNFSRSWKVCQKCVKLLKILWDMFIRMIRWWQ